MSVYLLIMHYIDIYWIVMPTLHVKDVHFALTDITSFVGIGGVFFWLFWRRYTQGPLVPVNDPGLKLSIEHVN
jgi:hypothetical protein